VQRTCADILISLHACSEAVAWAKQFGTDTESAWQECQRGDHMLWLLGKLSGEPGSDSRKAVVLAACECGRLALPQFEIRYPGDKRPRAAIETAESHCRGEATLKEVRTAAYAAYAAYAAAADAYAAAARSKRLAECADIVRKHFPKAPEITNL
jgi:hypothetical protein